ncbi:MAG: ribbon-helix-helix domain-containing protein [Nanoarchaeota archaeon]|nr:ribbon-helix-helix domain-containing protein [Nanoarchaeota archaeon]MBU1631976.1 ribbon-helix-helix domain-containing protein [Nanoarchaeota archaeon]MBU1876086.1 ribbon-helix-helix domain-containing protein [Nanoarchaeota archaeon]
MSTTLSGIEVVKMDFRKITVSIPENLYREGMDLIKSGLFSNFSDLIRSGIREEFKELRPVIEDFHERAIYSDKELIAGVKQSMKEAKAGKGKVLKSDKEMDEYFEAL